MQLLAHLHAAAPEFKCIVFLPAAHLANCTSLVIFNVGIVYYALGRAMAVSPLMRLAGDVYVQHARQSQSARTRVTQAFMQASVGVMFATDVVARGMHFPGVTHVVQGMCV